MTHNIESNQYAGNKEHTFINLFQFNYLLPVQPFILPVRKVANKGFNIMNFYAKHTGNCKM